MMSAHHLGTSAGERHDEHVGAGGAAAGSRRVSGVRVARLPAGWCRLTAVTGKPSGSGAAPPGKPDRAVFLLMSYRRSLFCPCSPTEEATRSERVQSRFESWWGYEKCGGMVRETRRSAGDPCTIAGEGSTPSSSTKYFGLLHDGRAPACKAGRSGFDSRVGLQQLGPGAIGVATAASIWARRTAALSPFRRVI